MRLIGVDTPETVDPSQPVGCYGPQASHFTEQTLTREPIRLEFDVERHDRYGRVLAYVWLRDHLFNQRLVAEGYAVVSTYPPNVRYEPRFEAARQIAMRDDRGALGRVSGWPRPSLRPGVPGRVHPVAAPGSGLRGRQLPQLPGAPPDPQNFDGDHNGIGCET